MKQAGLLRKWHISECRSVLITTLFGCVVNKSTYRYVTSESDNYIILCNLGSFLNASS